jgi:DNA adenine methylase
MEPFLKWAGGKRWLIPKLQDKLPTFGMYYEPFVGSGGLFFALEPKRAILSDTNPELINCYRCVRDHCNEVIRILKRLKSNKETYYKVRDKLYSKGDKVKRAAYFIYLNKTCWNGLYRVNQAGRFNVPVGRVNESVPVFDADQLVVASHLLKRAKLKCCDFQEAIAEASANDLVYFDPPYITTHLNNGFIKYNSKLFHHSDELRLARTAQYLAMKTVSVIVSNAAHPLIRQQYDGPFFKTEVRRTSIIAADPSHRSKIKELLITTFPVNIR